MADKTAQYLGADLRNLTKVPPCSIAAAVLAPERRAVQAVQSRPARVDCQARPPTHPQASAHDCVLLSVQQEACAGPLRDAARTQGAAFTELRAEQLRSCSTEGVQTVPGAAASCLSCCGSCRLLDSESSTFGGWPNAAAWCRYEGAGMHPGMARMLIMTDTFTCCRSWRPGRSRPSKEDRRVCGIYEEQDKQHRAVLAAVGTHPPWGWLTWMQMMAGVYEAYVSDLGHDSLSTAQPLIPSDVGFSDVSSI